MNTTFTNYAEKKAKQFLNLLQGYTRGIRITAILILLLMGVNNAWGLGYNGESHVYLDVNGTTNYYYKVSLEEWGTGCFLDGTFGGELKNQTFNDVQNLTIKGGAVGGWTNSGEKLSATLSYAVTTNTNTPSSWTDFGSISGQHTTYNNNNAFYYKNNGSTDVTPTTPGTYYLHIKIAFNSTSKTSYAKFTIPEPPTYTVAGSKEVLGSDWDQTDTNNDMTLSSGTSYTLTKDNVYLTNGNYECKVVQDHNWDKAWPDNNYSFSVQTTGRLCGTKNSKIMGRPNTLQKIKNQ